MHEAFVSAGSRGWDRADLEELVATYDHDLKRMCFAVLGDADSAQDAVQATWEIAIRKASQLRSREKVRNWLSAIAMNEARAVLRARKRKPDLPAPHLEEQRDIDLAMALNKLSVQDREILAITFVAGFTAPEAGEVLGITPEGVRTRKARAIARLRKELA